MLFSLLLHGARAEVPSQLEVNAKARAEGNRTDVAVALGRALLAKRGPAQILKVRVDAVGPHVVAGVMLEGRARRPFGREAFLDQVAEIASQSFSRSGVEEVDVWAVVPIPVPKGSIVSGPFAIPTNRTVFSAEFRRADRARIAAILRSGEGVFVDASWAQAMLAQRGAGGPVRPPVNVVGLRFMRGLHIVS